MGILDGIVEWIAKQVMNGLDLISTSVLGALGCDMGTFLRYFPAAETIYKVFVATAIGLVLLNWVWQLFKNFGLIAGVEAEDPFRLSIRSVLFVGLIYYCDQITEMVLAVGGTPYSWILSSDLPPLNFADFNSVLLTILGVCANGSVALIALILLLILAWNYIKWCFSHMFDKNLSDRRVRDYDNLECKQLLDTVAGFLMTDDSGLFCDAYHTTEFGERDCTILAVMEKSRFPGWLKEREDREKSVSDF